MISGSQEEKWIVFYLFDLFLINFKRVKETKGHSSDKTCRCGKPKGKEQSYNKPNKTGKENGKE